MRRYLDRCVTLIVELGDVVQPETIDQAQHLIDHGEPSIGMEYLAHGIVSQPAKVPASLVAELRDLIMDKAELPPNLDEWVEG